MSSTTEKGHFYTCPILPWLVGFGVLIFAPLFSIQAYSSEKKWEQENSAGMKAYHEKHFDQAKTRFSHALSSLGHTATPSPKKATTLNNLGAVHEALGEYEEAELRYRQSLIIIEKIQGSNHPDIVLSLNNLASLHFTTGNFEAAESLWKRALHILENFLGTDNPHLIPTLSTLGLLAQAQESSDLAEGYFTRAISIAENNLDLHHPQREKLLERYADFLRNSHRGQEADAIEKQINSIPKN